MAHRSLRQAHGIGWRPAAARASCFAALWLILAGANVGDLPALLVATSAASGASLLLLPPASTQPSAWGIGVLALDVLKRSVVAGADVAWRALSPSMPISPGYVTARVDLPPGPARCLFCTLMSVLPGSLLAGQDDDGRVVVHCLDVSQPVAAEISEEERLFVQAFGLETASD